MQFEVRAAWYCHNPTFGRRIYRLLSDLDFSSSDQDLFRKILMKSEHENNKKFFVVWIWFQSNVFNGLIIPKLTVCDDTDFLTDDIDDAIINNLTMSGFFRCTI